MSQRLLLARRASGRDHAVVFAGDHLRIEGGYAPRRRIPYRAVSGIERAAPWLWLGAGLVPAALGGRDVPAARLDAVERELRARIAALPAGAARVARVDRRPRSVRRVPWLTGAGVATAGVALLVAAALLLCLAFGLVVEGWLGRAAALVSALAGLLAGGAVLGGAGGGAAALPQLVSAGWIGLLAFARTVREAELSVLTRSAIDTAGLVALGFAALALAGGTPPGSLLAAWLAGFASGALALRRETRGRARGTTSGLH